MSRFTNIITTIRESINPNNDTIFYHGTYDTQHSAHDMLNIAKDYIDTHFKQEQDDALNSIRDYIKGKYPNMKDDSHIQTIDTIKKLQSVIEDPTLDKLIKAIPSQQNPFDYLKSQGVELDRTWKDFSLDKRGINTNASDTELGIFFTTNREFAEYFTQRHEYDEVTNTRTSKGSANSGVIKANLNYRNPLVLINMKPHTVQHLIDNNILTVEDNAEELSRSAQGSKELQQYISKDRERLIELGYDIVINKVKPHNFKVQYEYVALDPSIITVVSS